jgi:hypothetical protein
MAQGQLTQLLRYIGTHLLEPQHVMIGPQPPSDIDSNTEHILLRDNSLASRLHWSLSTLPRRLHTNGAGRGSNDDEVAYTEYRCKT